MKPAKYLLPLGLLLAGLHVATGVSAEPSAMPARGPIPFAEFDKDGNGSISESEFNAAREQRRAAQAETGRPMRGMGNAAGFADYDADGDGAISTTEFRETRKRMMEQRGGMGMRPGARQGRQRPDFTEYDLDGNGAISEQEFNQARGQRIRDRAQQGYQMRNLGKAPAFADIDSNGDGTISEEEFAQHQSMQRPGRMPR